MGKGHLWFMVDISIVHGIINQKISLGHHLKKTPWISGISPRSKGNSWDVSYKLLMPPILEPSILINAGWWLTYPSEKWSSSVGMIIPNIWKSKKCSKPTTRMWLCPNVGYSQILNFQYRETA